MAHRLRTLLFLMALALTASASEDDFTIGPWRLNMSKVEVSSFEQFGPYVPVRVTDGLETANGVLLDEARRVSFVFDGDGLRYIQAWEYEGNDVEAAKRSVHRIFELFQRSFGGATIDGMDLSADDGSAATLDSDALTALLAKVLGTAEQSGKLAAEKGSAMTLILDMRPVLQPKSSRLHAQWGYASRFNMYYVFLYQDRPSNPKRGAASMMHLERL